MGHPELKRKKGRKKNVFVRAWFDKLEKSLRRSPQRERAARNGKGLGKTSSSKSNL